MTYDEFLEELRIYAEDDFARFQRRLISTQAEILGVRTPTLRALAKKYFPLAEEFISYPDEYYEVTFIKLAMISLMEYDEFKNYVGRAVCGIDNWATCDSFKPKCLRTRQEDFLPILENIFSRGGEFDERFALVILLGFYVEEKYLPVIRIYIKKADTKRYYVRMAVAWLVAELLVKFSDFGRKILLSGTLDVATHNKAIQKARESYRIDEKQKEFLSSLKKTEKKTN